MINWEPFVEITTSSFCTNACSFCPQRLFHLAYASHLNKPIRFMSLPTFRKVISWAPVNFNIYFSGFSEPFMNPHCTEMILYAHKHHRKVTIFTTLMGVSFENITKITSELSLEDNDHLVVHLPSADNSELIKVTKEYLKILKYLLSLNKKNITFHYHGADLRQEVKLALQTSKMKANFSELVSRSGNVKLNDCSSPVSLKGKIKCLRQNMHEHNILPDGSVVLCCNDFGMQHILGNIYDNDYQSIHNSKMMKKIKQGLKDDKMDILCRKCHYAVSADIQARYLNASPLSKLLYYLPAKYAYFYPKRYQVLRRYIINLTGR